MKPDQAAMHMSPEEPQLEPCDLFVDMGMLIIEGRTPIVTTASTATAMATATAASTAGATAVIGDQRRCYGEGPHAPRMWDCGVPTSASTASSQLGSSSLVHQQRTTATAQHICDRHNPQCAQLEAFRKHMLLLWRNNIPMSIEVLLCPDCCRHGAVDRPNEPTDGPEPPTFVLLEQWTVQMMPRRVLELSIAPRVLMQAVRSYLHFSQLSAWYSQTGGRQPKNVVYRVCVPGEVFSNKFTKPPEGHVFPVSSVGWNNTLKVSVKTMPRTQFIPRVFCPLHDDVYETVGNGHAQDSVGCTVTKHQGPNGVGVAVGVAATTKTTATLTSGDTASKTSTRTKSPDDVAGSSATTDCMLGDSLLDPPPDLEMYPKRYRSPSRSGSPVMETPEHWLFGGRHGLRGRSRPPHPLDPTSAGLDGRRPRERCRPWRKMTSTTTTSLDFSPERSSERNVVVDGINDSRCKMAMSCEGHTKDATRRCCAREEVDCYMSEVLRDCDSSGRFLSHLKRRPPFSRLAAKFQNVNYDEDVLPSTSSSSSTSCDLQSLIQRAKMAEAQHRRSLASSRSFPTTATTPPLSSCTSFTMPPTTPLLQSKDAKSFVWIKKRLPISPLARDALASGYLTKTTAEEMRTNASMTTTTTTDGRLDADCVAKTTKTMDRCRSKVYEDDNDDEDIDGVSHRRLSENPSVAADPDHCQPSSPQPMQRKDLSSEDEEFGGNGLHQGFRKEVPSAVDKAKFRRSLDSAAYLVFHARTGLPLTSSPAPVRKGNSFDFDSSLTSVSAIKHALFDKDVSIVAEEEEEEEHVRQKLSTSAPASLNNNSNLLGNFEESVLNGRLEPVSTVEGFTAEIGASGSFCPRHVVRPVTVFFYTLSDVDKVSTPYLGHINLGKKGYLVPKSGTIQVTLFNPHGTVVKMFVVMYDLRDMPVRCQTFLRQRTLYMPVDASDNDPDARKWLRYLVHLRFASSKSGRIYLHTDIRMVIFRKSDMDVANIHGKVTYELRSFTKGPTMPRFSPRR